MFPRNAWGWNVSKRMIASLAALLTAFAVAAVCLSAALSLRALGENARAIGEVKAAMEGLDASLTRKQRNLAKWYNLKLKEKGEAENLSGAYGSILDVTGGAMGYVEVPALDLCLPILHEDGETADGAFRHRAETAFPVGGKGNHSLLEGGRLPQLSRLGAGDLIYVHILDGVLVYEVTQVREAFATAQVNTMTREGEDLCTLTGVLSRGARQMRVLVRAKRVDPEREQALLVEQTGPVLLDKGVIGAALAAALGAGLLPLVCRSLAEGALWLRKWAGVYKKERKKAA